METVKSSVEKIYQSNMSDWLINANSYVHNQAGLEQYITGIIKFYKDDIKGPKVLLGRLLEFYAQILFLSKHYGDKTNILKNLTADQKYVEEVINEVGGEEVSEVTKEQLLKRYNHKITTKEELMFTLQ